MSADQPIRILHLSDFHFKASKKWDADPVLRALAAFTKGEVKERLAPDLVAITGDLAFSGKADEYALARDWLQEQLWPAVGNLPRDRLLAGAGEPRRLSQGGRLRCASCSKSVASGGTRPKQEPGWDR